MSLKVRNYSLTKNRRFLCGEYELNHRPNAKTAALSRCFCITSVTFRRKCFRRNFILSRRRTSAACAAAPPCILTRQRGNKKFCESRHNFLTKPSAVPRRRIYAHGRTEAYKIPRTCDAEKRRKTFSRQNVTICPQTVDMYGAISYNLSRRFGLAILNF